MRDPAIRNVASPAQFRRGTDGVDVSSDRRRTNGLSKVTALTAPGRHQVDSYFESLDSLRFPTEQVEAELVALLGKKYVPMRRRGCAIGRASLDFAEKYHSGLRRTHP
jgi:hypothetical protein